MSHHFPAARGGIEGGGGSSSGGFRRQRRDDLGPGGGNPQERPCRVATLALCVGAAVGLVVLLFGGVSGGGGHGSSGGAGGEAGAVDKGGAPMAAGGKTFLEKVRLPGAPVKAPPVPETKQGRCAAAGKALRARGGWDYMRVMRQGEAAGASVVHQGSLVRLNEAIARANEEQRPLRIAVLGGSFSAGGAVADMRDSYAEVLASLLSGTETDGGDGPTGRGKDKVLPSPLTHGAEVTNMAQGGAGFMLPLFCTMKVYSMVAEDPTVAPDVWVVEFGENFDASLDQYEALLAMLLFDEARFGRPAVLTAAVAKNFCWWSEGGVRSTQCGLHRTMGWLQEAAQTMDVPLVSFLHGVAPFVGFKAEEQPASSSSSNTTTYATLPALLLQNSGDLDGKVFPGLYGRLDKVVKQLYADCGENQHFNEYGHRLLGHFLYHLFQEATHDPITSSNNKEALALKEAGVRERMPPRATEVFQRVSSGSTSQTLTCNLTLTQGRAVDLVPVASRNYSLWAEKAEGSSNIFSGARKRSDRKQTYTPDMEGATLDFDLPIAKGASTLCVLMYGASGMFLNASFPGHASLTATRAELIKAGRLPAPTPVSPSPDGDEDDDDEEGLWVQGEDGRCRQVQPDGSIRTADCAALAPSEKKAAATTSTSTSKKTTSSTTSKQHAQTKKGKKESGSDPHERVTVDSTCVYRGGVDWTIYSVYKIDCGCQLPPALADGATHRVRLTNARGKVQVAGVVIW